MSARSGLQQMGPVRVAECAHLVERFARPAVLKLAKDLASTIYDHRRGGLMAKKSRIVRIKLVLAAAGEWFVTMTTGFVGVAVWFRLGNMQLDGLLTVGGVGLGLTFGFTSLMYNRARAFPDDAMQRRCLRASELALRGSMAFIASHGLQRVHILSSERFRLPLLAREQVARSSRAEPRHSAGGAARGVCLQPLRQGCAPGLAQCSADDQHVAIPAPTAK